MPATLTYPGVYIEEIPSGVRTITGVATSITAFAGASKSGPIDDPVQLLSFADYERRFGGLADASEMSYAIRQFFLNGGTEAWAVRVAKGALAATNDLNDDSGNPSLRITAYDKGKTGEDIELRIDRDTSNPGSTFNLTAIYGSTANPPPDARTEVFRNLSMNHSDARYVAQVLKDESQLISAEPLANYGTLGSGTSRSGDLVDGGGNLLDVSTLVDATHNELQLSVNGGDPVKVVLNPATDTTGNSNTAKLTTLCKALRDKASAASGNDPAFAGASFCTRDNSAILFSSAVAGETSSVRVLPGERNDVTARLELGPGNGGVEQDATAPIRPALTPDPATLTSDTFASNDLNALPDNTHTAFAISLNGFAADTVDIGATAAAGGNLAAKLGDVAARIQTAVRALKSNPAYRNFTCTVDASGKKLVLATGTRGSGSSIVVGAAAANSIANELHLLTGSTTNSPQNFMLLNGNDGTFDITDYSTFIGDPVARTGIYALEDVDLFNLLVLPGVTDAGILMDAAAYCESRRAFLIVDAPVKGTENDPVSAMEKAVTGTALPKSSNAAVFFPWIQIADPLRGGSLRTVAPSGTVAGVYARTDSARGVWKAPAGTEASLTGVRALTYTLTNGENGVLNPHAANCLRNFPVFGPISWGARTLRGDDQITDDPSWKYVPVRRLALYMEESLYRGTQWVVFEPNDEPLWSQIRLNVGSFMHDLFRQGAFQGQKPSDAYFVKCDKETTTQSDINLGIVNIIVGFAPLKPAEFVVIKIQQMAGQIAT
jgi:phage tail sheath protein FI